MDKIDSKLNTMKPKRHYRTFSEESLQEALRLILTTNLTPGKASKRFNVPTSTLRAYLKRCKGNINNVKLLKVGCESKMPKNDEDRLISYMKWMADHNQPVTNEIMKTVAESLLNKNNRGDKIKVSHEWCRRMRKKHKVSVKIVGQTQTKYIEEKNPKFSEAQLMAAEASVIAKEREEDEIIKQPASISSCALPKLHNIVIPHCLQESEEKKITQKNEESMVEMIKEEADDTSISSFVLPKLHKIVIPQCLQESEEMQIAQTNGESANETDEGNMKDELEKLMYEKTISQHGRSIVKLNYSTLHKGIKALNGTEEETEKVSSENNNTKEEDFCPQCNTADDGLGTEWIGCDQCPKWWHRHCLPAAERAQADLSLIDHSVMFHCPYCINDNICDICRQREGDPIIITCGLCTRNYHLRCLSPQANIEYITLVHKNKRWYCEKCYSDS